MANFLTAVLTNVLKRDTQQKTHATQQINTQCYRNTNPRCLTQSLYNRMEEHILQAAFGIKYQINKH